MIYHVYSLMILLISVNSICNYIAVDNTAYVLDTCYKHSTVANTSRGYFCIINETTASYQAQFLWWQDSIDCGVSTDEEATVAGDELYECGGAEDDCYCSGGNTDDCDIAIKTTWAGDPGSCDSIHYEKESLVLGVCIPSSSESITSSKIVECTSDGITNVVYATDDCSGDVVERNTDDIDTDTCYEIDCESGTNPLSYTYSLIIVTLCLSLKLLY